jgi:hypothetical protein
MKKYSKPTGYTYVCITENFDLYRVIEGGIEERGYACLQPTSETKIKLSREDYLYLLKQSIEAL